MYTLKDLAYQKVIRSRNDLLQHMKEFSLKLKMSVGIWYFTPGGGRFHDAYVEPKSIAERLKMAEELAEYGIAGIEAHYPAEVNFDNLHLYQELEKNAGIKLVGVPFSHFFDKDFEFGSLSNPYPKIRNKAIRIAADGLIEALRDGLGFHLQIGHLLCEGGDAGGVVIHFSGNGADFLQHGVRPGFFTRRARLQFG